MILNSIETVVRKKFAEYYSENAAAIRVPPSMSKREFGFLLFKEKMMIRHKGFRDPLELIHFIKAMVPSDIYYSAAYYEEPEESMEMKKWFGADLVFDIDADHIQTPCKVQHDFWMCENCKNTGRGQKPEKCPKCGSEKFKEEAWLCESCLEAAKTETLKLIDFLTDDLGFLTNEVEVYFSGHRGYHVHIRNEDVKKLDQLARKEIVDYIMGTGLKAEFHGLREKGRRKLREVVGPDLYDPGWRGRLARGVYDFLITATPEKLEKIEGMKKATIERVITNRNVLLEAWRKKAPWEAVRGVGVKTWKKIVDYAVEKQIANIDTVVTTDIHRLIRMSTTLHGKTGLKVTLAPVEKLEDFDPLSEAIAFKKETLTVYVNEAHEFRLGEETYGPYKKQKIELPMAVAMFLLCKRVAFPVR